MITLFWVTLNGIALLRMKIFSARTSARDTVSGRHGICGGDLTEPTSLQPIPSAGRILGQYPGFRDKTSGRVHPADLSANRQWRPTAQDVVGNETFAANTPIANRLKNACSIRLVVLSGCFPKTTMRASAMPNAIPHKMPMRRRFMARLVLQPASVCKLLRSEQREEVAK